VCDRVGYNVGKRDMNMKIMMS